MPSKCPSHPISPPKLNHVVVETGGTTAQALTNLPPRRRPSITQTVEAVTFGWGGCKRHNHDMGRTASLPTPGGVSRRRRPPRPTSGWSRGKDRPPTHRDHHQPPSIRTQPVPQQLAAITLSSKRHRRAPSSCVRHISRSRREIASRDQGRDPPGSSGGWASQQAATHHVTRTRRQPGQPKPPRSRAREQPATP